MRCGSKPVFSVRQRPGIFHGIRAFVPRVIAAGTPGRIVDTSSGDGGIAPLPQPPPDATSPAFARGGSVRLWWRPDPAGAGQPEPHEGLRGRGRGFGHAPHARRRVEREPPECGEPVQAMHPAPCTRGNRVGY